MKRTIVIGLIIAFLISNFGIAVGYLTLSDSEETIGFGNGSYIGFRDVTVFATTADGGYTQLMPSSNATYPDYLFLQKQGDNAIYGFYCSGVNVTVNSYFVNDVLELDCVGSGSVKVQTGSRGAPVSVSGASCIFDQVNRIATVSVTSSGVVQLSWASSEGPGSVINPTPTPTPTVPYSSPVPFSTPTYVGPPLGEVDFQVATIDLGQVQPNSTVTATLNFRYSGSNYVLQSLYFTEPFNSWYIPSGNLSSLMYILGSGSVNQNSIDIVFYVPDVPLQKYEGLFNVTAVDAFGALHTCTGNIVADVSAQGFDLWGFISNPIVLFVIVVVVVVLVLAAKSKRR